MARQVKEEGHFSSTKWVETGEVRNPVKGEFWLNASGSIWTTTEDCPDGSSPTGVGPRRIIRRTQETPEVEQPSTTAKWNGIGWYEV